MSHDESGATAPSRVPQNYTEYEGDRQFATTLARGLELLRCFTPEHTLLGNKELAQRMALPRPTISRLTYTLTKLGYLEHAQDTSGATGYRLGSAVLALGSTMLARMDMRAVARPLMQELADHTHAMVSLGMRDRTSMIYVENCRSESALTLSLDVGSRIPIATTAMGRSRRNGLTPQACNATNSRSDERRPKPIRIPRRTDIGMVRLSACGSSRISR